MVVWNDVLLPKYDSVRLQVSEVGVVSLISNPIFQNRRAKKAAGVHKLSPESVLGLRR